MSGGRFNYDQYKIGYIADEIEKYIEKNGRPKTKKELADEPYFGADYYKEFPEALNHYEYPEEVIEKFKEAVKALRAAEIYAHRVDWLLSGDDGEESFLKRLNQGLESLNKISEME
jgi:hypothetical protein